MEKCHTKNRHAGYETNLNILVTDTVIGGQADVHCMHNVQLSLTKYNICTYTKKIMAGSCTCSEKCILFFSVFHAIKNAFPYQGKVNGLKIVYMYQ